VQARLAVKESPLVGAAQSDVSEDQGAVADDHTRDGEPQFGLVYDMRNPAFAGVSFEDYYSRVLEQVRWAETAGMDAVWVPEHHFVEDGYTPSPLLVLTAIAAQTTRMRLGTSVIIPAFHNPIRIAEDAATLSIISNGRFDLGLGLGYRQVDFEAFGRRVEHRVSLLEETVEVVRRAMAGEPLSFDSKRFHLPDEVMGPLPARPPRILLGAHKKVAIERAARIGDGFLMGTAVNSDSGDDYEVYLQALADLGKDPADAYICAVQFSIVAEDPEAAWANEIGDCALYKANMYAKWGAFPGISGFESRDDLIARGLYVLSDGPTAAAELTSALSKRPQIRGIQCNALIAGESFESSSARLEYYLRTVVGPVRENLRKIRESTMEDANA
jgi:alkanesulfonate monooxygenase SsuD/methylene tetrahydromethanopterin reductase-like flavin-dependent oxidoreductase (luciferase family)